MLRKLVSWSREFHLQQTRTGLFSEWPAQSSQSKSKSWWVSGEFSHKKRSCCFCYILGVRARLASGIRKRHLTLDSMSSNLSFQKPAWREIREFLVFFCVLKQCADIMEVSKLTLNCSLFLLLLMYECCPIFLAICSALHMTATSSYNNLFLTVAIIKIMLQFLCP